MDMAFDAKDEAWREEVRSFMRENLPPDVAHKVHNGFGVSKPEIMDWHAKLYAKRWVAPNWPAQWGGPDPAWTVTQKYIYDEEASLAGAPRLILFGITMCGPVLMRYGTDEQKNEFLPKIVAGERIFCQGYSEPGSGSDLASLKMKAERDGDHFVLNGQKIWTTSAHMADWIFCLVRTSNTGKRQEGITFILVDMATPGVTVKPLITIEGTREVNEVFFDDVRVPATNVIGEVDDGWSVAKYLLGHERMGGGALGGLKKSLEQLKKIAREEPTGGDGALIDDSAFAAKVYETEIELTTLEVQMLRLLSKMSADREMGLEASMIKIRRSEIIQRLAELKMEAVGYYANPFVLGAMEQGWNEEPIGGADYINALAAQYFNNRKQSIFAGSNEIQHNIIAKRVLGL
jgi:alkylation response protein AidB-like acyl-CoA dehydrogenase